MVDKVAIDDSQLQRLISSVDALADHAPIWQHFLVAALPIFLASLLGFATAYLLDWLKTRRENRKVARERLEKELTLLSGVNTLIGSNVTFLIHTVMQQILPHYYKSKSGFEAIEALHAGSIDPKQFNHLMHSEFQPIMRRCPVPFLEDVNLSRDLPFLITKDPSLIMLSSWVITYAVHLKSILTERNRLIDIATLDNSKDDLDLSTLERQIEAQASIADAEIVNAYQLFLQLTEASEKIAGIIETEYKDVIGPKLKVGPPEMFGSLMTELERIAKSVAPDWPPPEPPAV
jgi:hypothetical protein